jgi:hypothetical protein
MEKFTAQKQPKEGSTTELLLQHSQGNLAVKSGYKTLNTSQRKQNR